MSINPWDIAMQRYKAEQQGINSTEPASETDLSSAFDIAQNIYDSQSQEANWWDDAKRHATRTGSRMVETILGLPGDVVKLAKKTGEILPKPPEWLQGRQSFIQELGAPLLEKIPGQQELQRLSEEKSGGYTAPRSPQEGTSDEVFKTFAGLMSGGSFRGATRLPQAMQWFNKSVRNLGTSLASETAKEGIKMYGGKESTQEAAKLGTLFLLGLTLPRLTRETSPENYLSSIYRERDALIPQGTMITPTGLEHDLQNFLTKTIRYGGTTPEKKQVGSVAEEFFKKLQGGQSIEMDELLQMYRDINRNRASVMSVENLDKAGVAAARRYYGDLANMFNQTIEGYLGTINPRALELHKMANSGWSALNQSNRTSQFILNKAKDIPLKTAVTGLFGGGFYAPAATAAAVGKAAAIGAPVATGVAGAELAYRFLSNPTLRHYYLQVINSAMRENAPAMTKALKRLDDAYFKELQNPESEVNTPFGQQRMNKPKE